MTTEAAANLYRAQHEVEMEGRKVAVFNPYDKPVDELPIIYGFNNGGSPEWLSAIAIAEDGNYLGGHTCSHEGYMPNDLGILEGTRLDRHKDQYQVHYPDGYRMMFVKSEEFEEHKGLKQALENNNKIQAAETE